MNVKLSDVARSAGVSKATVSLALNGSKKINNLTRERIVQLARKMGYSPNPYARRLVTRKSDMIGLIIPDIENVFYASLVHQMATLLKSNVYSLFISISHNSRLAERRIVREMIENRMDALFLVPVNKPNDDLSYLKMLDDAGMPTLFLTASYKNVDQPGVMCDLYGGMKLMIGELYAKGYRKIAMISGPANVFCLDLRIDGYMDAARELGLQYVRIDRVEQVTYQHAYEFVKNMEAFDSDAIVCVNDMMALGVINALGEKGLRVPLDIAVAGYDDVIFSQISPVPITTIRQDLTRLSAEAVEMMLRLIKGENIPLPDRQKILSCELIVRQSTP